MDPSVVLHNVSLDLPIVGGVAHATRGHAARVGGRIWQSNGHTYVTALHNISLSISSGDRLAVIGHNGAGKTSLLRIISGIYQPTSGRRSVRGRLSALFSSTIGLDLDATGLEGIRFACMLYGIPRSRLSQIIDDVREFSGLGEYLELPIRSYSTGMRTRLGFGIITSVDPDILVVDEVVSTGDFSFEEKASTRIRNLLKRIKILIVAAHSHDALRQLCDTCVWFERGEIVMHGPFDTVWDAYIKGNRPSAEKAEALVGSVPKVPM